MSKFNLSNIGIVLIFASFAFALLPDSPFTLFISTLDKLPYLDVLNWFIPVSEMVAIGQAWLIAITAFYVVSLILSWINAIR